MCVCTLDTKKKGVTIRRGLVFLQNRHELGGVVNSWRPMINKQYGDPNISMLLQLVVNIV